MATGSHAVNNTSITDTPFGYTLSIIGGKWKMILIYLLYHHKVVRYNELKRLAGVITYKTLSAQLKELVADGLVHREEYPQIPPMVEYSLTPKGESLIPIMDAICDWGLMHRITQEGWHPEIIAIGVSIFLKVLRCQRRSLALKTGGIAFAKDCGCFG